MISNRELPNRTYFNFDLPGLIDKADDTLTKGENAAKKLGDSVSDIKNKLHPGSSDSTPAPTTKSETLILGMHPITLVIGTLSILALTTITVVAYKHFKK